MSSSQSASALVETVRELRALAAGAPDGGARPLSDAPLLLADLKALNRAAHLSVEARRQAVAAASALADARHLSLQNLLYERASLMRQIQRCRDFPSADFDRVQAQLVPPEETLRAAAAALAAAAAPGAAAAVPAWVASLAAAHPALLEAAQQALLLPVAAASVPATLATASSLSSTSSSGSVVGFVAAAAAQGPAAAAVASSSASAGPQAHALRAALQALGGAPDADAHEVVLARLQHELEQRKALEAEVAAAKARTQQLRALSRQRALLLQEQLPVLLRGVEAEANRMQVALDAELAAMAARAPAVAVEGAEGAAPEQAARGRSAKRPRADAAR